MLIRLVIFVNATYHRTNVYYLTRSNQKFAGVAFRSLPSAPTALACLSVGDSVILQLNSNTLR